MGGTVICASGCCAAYRTDLVRRELDGWEFQRFLGDCVFDLFEFQIALKPATADGSLFDFRRRITEGKPLVIEVTVLAQTRDDSLDDRLVSL